MTIWAEILWLLMGSGVILYALTGGPDLGAGVWHLLARGPRKAQQRELLLHAIAPIWEANHIWLIFVIVVMFAAFSRAFSAVSIALHIPIALATLGMVFRGAAFAFHSYGIHTEETKRAWSRVFSGSSIVTPVLLGSVAGALGSGDIRVINGTVTTGFLAGWTTPFALFVGCFTLALFATLAAVYLTAEAQDPALADDFRRRALAAEVVTGFFAALVVWRANIEAPQLHAVLMRSTWTWAVQIATALLAFATIYLLWVRRPRLARLTSALQVALVVIGWGLAMDQHFILPDVSVEYAIGYAPVLKAYVITVAVALVILAPAFWYLLRVFKLEHKR
jgi:cytochrome bd ubiquinol oxidase subunit II